MDKIEAYVDNWGRFWRLPRKEICDVCGQPDSCKDCNHIKIPDDAAKDMGAIIKVQGGKK